MTNNIHETAIVASGAKLGAEVKIGPYCVVGENVVLGDRVELKSHVVVEGRTTIGEDTVIFPFASIGHPPQDLKFKGYEIISTLGEGGLGSVFKSRQVSMNRLVAFKVLHNQWISDDEFRKRFVLEARIVGKLSHQNLIQVYDVGREGDYYYFSMEYVDGRTVEDLIREAPRHQMEVARAVDIIIQTLRAINYYKDFDIVHRDIKPSNIMITRSGLVKVGDFGFVKSKLDKELGYEGMVLGTPDYIAPEQAMGKEDVDYRADIYSLGATFYHMVTGRPMYDGTPSKVMLAHTRTAMPDPRTYRPSLSDDVVAVLQRMLEKDPNKRYANINNLFADLEALRDAHKPKAPSKFEIGKSSFRQRFYFRVIARHQPPTGERRDIRRSDYFVSDCLQK